MVARLSPGNPVATEPFFLEVPQGRLYAVYRRPPAGTPLRGNVLHVPPFNEEMNRCRSMVTMQAHELARLGFGTLSIDLLGTGDSSGEYRDGRWSIWLDNLKAGLTWLDGQPGGQRFLWGTRLGALLATELHAALGSSALGLMLWQPVLDGKQYFTQFLRLRLAAQMYRTDIPKETTGSLRELLARGETVEVSGYEIHPELAHAMEASRLAAGLPAPGAPLLWLESVSAGGQTLSPASEAVLETWRGAGRKPSVETFEGPQFWQVHERVETPQAIQKTTAWVASHIGEACPA